MTQPVKHGQAPSHMWGSSGEMLLNIDGEGKATIQLAQVTLPGPAVCSVYFQARYLEDGAPGGFIQSLTLNLYTGLGRITIPRTIDFANQPAPLAPLEFTIPFVPLHVLQADVAASAQALGGGFLRLAVQLQLSPISHIPQDRQPLLFGMAVPGEADQMDDSLREDLEQAAPDQAAIMAARQGDNPEDPDTFYDDGEEPDDDDDDDDEEPPAGRVLVPRAWQAKIDRLARRLGRPVRGSDLTESQRKALARAMRRQG